MLGAGAVVALTLAIWLPAQSSEAIVRRRITGFMQAGTARPGGLAMDLGGQSRWRAARRMRRQAQDATGRGQWEYLERKLANAQLAVTPVEYAMGVGAATVVAVVIAMIVTGGEPLFLAVGIAVPVLSILYLNWRYARILGRFKDQLADTITLLASSVRTGHSVQQALEHVTQELPEPTKSAFALVVREIGLGASMEESLTRLSERFPSEDVELFVTAVNVHATIGGSLAKVLDATADTVRERYRIAAEVSALTAQQRYAAYVLALLPVITLVGLRFISPEYASALFAPGGLRIALAGAGLLVISGFLIMRKMSQVDD